MDNRKSNIELLRIVSMSMIIIHHFLVHVLSVGAKNQEVYRFFDQFFIYGVNLFFLISGYFKIKLSVSSLVKIIGLIFIFRVISGVMIFINGGTLDLKYLIMLVLFPVSQSDYWFIEVYLGLMIISPFLSKGLAIMQKKQLRAVMILFTLFTVYSCNLGTNDSNPTGYQLGQAIYLYCLAHWLKEERDWLKRVKNKQLIVAFGVLSIISGIGYAVTYHFAFNAYNSILVISGAICLFLYFTRLDFNNKFVNKMATAALGSYLLQDGVWGNQIYKWLQSFIGSGYHLFFEIMAFVGCFVAFWIVSYFLTIAANRIVKYVIKTIPKKVLDINFVN